MEEPIAKGHFILKKFPGKGGWTYAELPEIPLNANNPFGWVKVKGLIDTYQLKQFKLMPMGNGGVFLSVRAEIRRKIKKEAGDQVYVELYKDESKLLIPQEILECFKDEPQIVFTTFSSFTQGEQKSYLDWIYKTKSEDTKADRILSMMKRLKKGLTFYDKE